MRRPLTGVPQRSLRTKTVQDDRPESDRRRQELPGRRAPRAPRGAAGQGHNCNARLLAVCGIGTRGSWLRLRGAQVRRVFTTPVSSTCAHGSILAGQSVHPSAGPTHCSAGHAAAAGPAVRAAGPVRAARPSGPRDPVPM